MHQDKLVLAKDKVVVNALLAHLSAFICKRLAKIGRC